MSGFFGDYERVVERGAVLGRRDRGLLRLTGAQRIWFLQNTITCDVDTTAPGSWVEGCFLDPKGRLLAHFRVGVADDAAWLDIDPPATESLLDWFVRYRFRTKVDIEDVSTGAFGVLGPVAAELVGRGRMRVEADGIAFGDMLGDVPVAEVHASGLPSWVPDLPRVGDDVYELVRVEAGVGRFGVDYRPGMLPQEAGLSRALSVDKGCYVGQETVARIHFRGHVNRVVRKLALDGVEAARAVGRALVWEHDVVGEITSAASSPTQGTIGLGLVRVEPPESSVLDVDGGGSAVLGPVPDGTKVRETPS